MRGHHDLLNRFSFIALSILVVVLFVNSFPVDGADPDYVKSAYAASVSVFSTNFNAGAPGQFSGITTTESVQGYAGVGGFSGNFLRNTDATAPTQAKTTLTLNNLPCHTSIDVNFDLAIMDTWDGIGSGTFADGSPTGPDALAVTVDGNQVFKEVFAIGQGTQTYNPPAPIKIGATVQRGFHPDWPDAAYAMSLETAFHGISHTSSSLKIDWFASSPGWEGGINESWGIDNVEVVLNGIDDPSCTKATKTTVEQTTTSFEFKTYTEITVTVTDISQNPTNPQGPIPRLTVDDSVGSVRFSECIPSGTDSLKCIFFFDFPQYSDYTGKAKATYAGNGIHQASNGEKDIVIRDENVGGLDATEQFYNSLNRNYLRIKALPAFNDGPIFGPLFLATGTNGENIEFWLKGYGGNWPGRSSDTICAGKYCPHTVTLCGNVVSKHILSDMEYGFVANRVGATWKETVFGLGYHDKKKLLNNPAWQATWIGKNIAQDWNRKIKSIGDFCSEFNSFTGALNVFHNEERTTQNCVICKDQCNKADVLKDFSTWPWELRDGTINYPP